MVTVKPPAEMATPQRLGSVRYQRPDAHRKHVHTEQGHYRELAQRDGFDDALLTGPDGLVCETSMANIGFFDRSGVVWPDAPMLRGITMQLLEAPFPTRRTPMRLSDIASFDGAFVSNARGIGVVSPDRRRGAPDARRPDAVAHRRVRVGPLGRDLTRSACAQDQERAVTEQGKGTADPQSVSRSSFRAAKRGSSSLARRPPSPLPTEG